jgi:alcohol dehydrogenase class IV
MWVMLTDTIVEALYAEKCNPVSTMLALDSIRALSSGLPVIVKDPSSKESRSSVLYGAFIAGMTVASTGIALHHKLAHAVGGTLNFPHAETHSIILPHSIAYNAQAIDNDVLAGLGKSLAQSRGESVVDVITGLNKLIRDLGIPTALRDLGMKEEDIDRCTDVALEKAYWNPRLLEKDKIKEVLRRAWAGEEARPDL